MAVRLNKCQVTSWFVDSWQLKNLAFINHRFTSCFFDHSFTISSGKPRVKCSVHG
jgi:hypothetical protein